MSTLYLEETENDGVKVHVGFPEGAAPESWLRVTGSAEAVDRLAELIADQASELEGREITTPVYVCGRCRP
jgi:hypothetical protein